MKIKFEVWVRPDEAELLDWCEKKQVPDDGQKRVALTKKEIMQLIECPVVYTSEHDGMFIKIKRFSNDVDKLFGEETDG